MNTTYNFQINPDKERRQWDEIKAHAYPFEDRVTAVLFAKRLARVFQAEVRMTEGRDPARLSGSYFRHSQA